MTKKLHKPEALPSLWPNVPSEKLKQLPIPRKTQKASAETRRLSDETVMVDNDRISCLEDITTAKINMPRLFHLVREPGAIVFLKLMTTGMPKNITSLKIFDTLEFQLWSCDENLDIKDIVMVYRVSRNL